MKYNTRIGNFTLKKKRKVARIMLVVMTLISILSIATIMTGCGKKPPITSGEIYGKEYIPALDWSERVKHIRSVKPIMFYYTTEHHHTPQKWILHLRQYDANEHCWIYAAFEVSKDIYEQYDFYDTYEVPYE